MMLSCGLIWAQASPQVPAAGAPQQPGEAVAQPAQLRSNYVLRPGDQILIRAANMEEISNQPFRIDDDGFVTLPELGRIKASDVSVENFEAVLVEALKKYVRVPQVSITVVQFNSEPVFFAGAFKVPGLYPLVGQRNLVEMMTSVGGLQQGASKRIKVTRRKEYGPIPLPNAITLPDGGSSVEISIATLQNNVNPAEDIVLRPYDVISVEVAEQIYVMGDGVGRAGALALGEKESMSVLQVLVQSGVSTSKLGNAIILRPITNTARRAAIPLDIRSILKGQGNDKPLLANDVLYVQQSKNRFSARSLLTILPLIGIGLTILNLVTRF